MQPQNTNNNYDFIVQSQAPAKTGFLSGIKPIYLIGGVVVLLLLVIVAFGVIAGGKKGSALIEPLGKAGEIIRVNTDEIPKLKDPGAVAIATTANTSLLSDQTQINKYLSSHKIKPSKKKLEAYKNASVEPKLDAALANNNFDATYLAYLKSALSDYAASLKNAYPQIKTNDGKALAQEAYTSTSVLLSSAQLK